MPLTNGPAVDDRHDDAGPAVGDLDQRAARQRLVGDADELACVSFWPQAVVLP